MDFPIKNGGSFHSYVKLPEGNKWKCSIATFDDTGGDPPNRRSAQFLEPSRSARLSCTNTTRPSVPFHGQRVLVGAPKLSCPGDHGFATM